MKDIKYCYENKNFVVVGASSGMGKQIVFDLAEAGANILAVARNESRLQELKERSPEQIFIAKLDVLKASSKEWEEAFDNFVNVNGKINGGVYTAGITGMTPLRMYDQLMAEAIVDTSLWGMAHFVQIATKKKFAAQNSSYVVFASTAAYCGNRGQFAYSAAKGAVQAAVRSISKEICRDMHRINSISPGWVETDMSQKASEEIGEKRLKEIYNAYPLGIGKPDDVSGTALFLLSDAARWITGTDIVIDGGSLLGTH